VRRDRILASAGSGPAAGGPFPPPYRWGEESAADEQTPSVTPRAPVEDRTQVVRRTAPGATPTPMTAERTQVVPRRAASTPPASTPPASTPPASTPPAPRPPHLLRLRPCPTIARRWCPAARHRASPSPLRPTARRWCGRARRGPDIRMSARRPGPEELQGQRAIGAHLRCVRKGRCRRGRWISRSLRLPPATPTGRHSGRRGTISGCFPRLPWWSSSSSSGLFSGSCCKPWV